MKPLLLVLGAGLALTAEPARADDASLPGGGFPASRYETLWTKSPFAVATSEAAPASSPDYFLVGIAKFDDVSYASVIERQNQEHFLISTDKPTRGLTLTSITRGQDGTDTYAVVLKDGQSITLKLEQPPVTEAIPGAPPLNPLAIPGGMTPQIPMPGTGLQSPVGTRRPFIRYHRSLIHMPPMPPPFEQPVAPPPVPAPPPSQ